MISLAVANQINLTSTLWFTGIWNILSGLLFQVPVCVQPMKGNGIFVNFTLNLIMPSIAIAAIVLTKDMSIEENMAAGLGNKLSLQIIKTRLILFSI